MTTPLYDLARPVVQSMQAYQPGKPIEEAQRELGIAEFVKLASNENPRGPSKTVLNAMNAAVNSVNRYPDANGFYLKQAIAERFESFGVDSTWVTLGCGSNDILELVASAFLDSDTSAIYSQYGFLVYGLATARSGAKAIIVDAKNYAHDLAAMAKAVEPNTRVIFIANPNNPTGTYANETDLLNLLGSVPSSVLVVLDEAYFEYIDKADYPSSAALLRRYPNLIITRTFSKAFGLSALRVGYAICDPVIADMLNRVRQPFNVTSIALEAAIAALSDEQYLQESIALNREGMHQLEAGFADLDLDYIPSVANFITFKTPFDAMEVNQQLLQKGIIVRPVGNYLMNDYLRVSIGLESENACFLQALAKVIDEHK